MAGKILKTFKEANKEEDGSVSFQNQESSIKI